MSSLNAGSFARMSLGQAQNPFANPSPSAPAAQNASPPGATQSAPVGNRGVPRQGMLPSQMGRSPQQSPFQTLASPQQSSQDNIYQQAFARMFPTGGWGI